MFGQHDQQRPFYPLSPAVRVNTTFLTKVFNSHQAFRAKNKPTVLALSFRELGEQYQS